MIEYTCWRDHGYFLGYLDDYPDYVTQGLSEQELIDNLMSLLEDNESGEVPFVR